MMQRLFAIIALLLIATSLSLAAELRLTYDANGNLVTGDGKYRVYNSFNSLAAVYNGSSTSGTLLETYVYHPTEERILKKTAYNGDGSIRETTYYITQTFVRIVNASGTFDETFVYHNGQLVAQNLHGTKLYMANDHKGNVVAVMNASGAVVENTSYSPYGAIVNGGIQSKKGYEGKEADSLVGDTDFNARKYRADLGIFTQPDPLLQNPVDPQTLNRLSFERENPYRYVDPTGHFIIGYQTAGEGALAGGVGYARGEIWEMHTDGTYSHYTFTARSFGGGVGGSASQEGIIGFQTTANGFGGKAYTGQGGLTGPQEVGPGFTGSGNVPEDEHGNPLWAQVYGTGGYAVIAGIAGAQVYGGESTTHMIFVDAGYWNPFILASQPSQADIAAKQKPQATTGSSNSEHSSYGHLLNDGGPGKAPTLVGPNQSSPGLDLASPSSGGNTGTSTGAGGLDLACHRNC